jgi:hypothetical protein
MLTVKGRGKFSWSGCYLALFAGLSAPLCAEIRVLQLTIKDHLFSPATLYVPAGEKIKLVIHNQDPTPEEFESFSLNREKVILGQSKGVVFVGPLLPGEHAFVGEYHPDSARGQIVVLPLAQWLAKGQADAD